jgi:hypothetical protein
MYFPVRRRTDKEPQRNMKTVIPRIFSVLVLMCGMTAIAFSQPGGGRGPGGFGAVGPAGPPPKLTKIKDDLYFVENQAAKMPDLIAYGGNLTIYLTSAGVVLVDSKSHRSDRSRS